MITGYWVTGSIAVISEKQLITITVNVSQNHYQQLAKQNQNNVQQIMCIFYRIYHTKLLSEPMLTIVLKLESKYNNFETRNLKMSSASCHPFCLSLSGLKSNHSLGIYILAESKHDDVIKWKHFPRYWPFVRGIHRSPVNSRTKASDAELWCFLWSASE